MTSNLSDTITPLTNGGAERWRPRVPASTYLITALCELSGGCAQPSLSGARSPKYYVEIAAVVARSLPNASVAAVCGIYNFT